MIPGDLKIIFQDEWIVAINKPSGLLVHRTNLDPEEKYFAMTMLRDQIGCWVYPIHRLDKGTSGVLLFSKNQEMASVLGQMILNHQFTKEYLAIVRGYSPDEAVIDYPVPQGRKEERKPALSRFRTLTRTEINEAVGIFETARYSVLSVIPETGRRHQIRRHLKHIFYPIIGDRRYGDRAHNKFFKNKLDLTEMFLHARILSFTHPIGKEEICIEADLPDHWSKALNCISIKPEYLLNLLQKK